VRILHWFRKDLRLDDNVALSEAARDAGGDVVPFYASEPAILGRDDMAPVRVRFALDALAALAADVRAAGSELALAHGDAATRVLEAAKACGADAVYWNDEYEPSLRARDEAVERALRNAGVRVQRFHDRLLVPPGAVMTREGNPYTVYTPFARACEAFEISAPFAVPARLAPHALPAPALATLERLGFATPAAPRWPAGEGAARERLHAFLAGAGGAGASLADYPERRDTPATPAGSRLSADLKFGTVGIRRVVAELRGAANDAPRRAGAAKFLSELRWRDFYAHVLWHFPHVEHGAFRPEYDGIRWEGREEHFDAWREGRTGYPIVDAGMRELLATGFMHNRVRMIVASFLTKDLLLDWRLGERHFMRHLIDGDLANNNGGWQWAAGTGTDAAPWFRIFNPSLQAARFDPQDAYVARWCPETPMEGYPPPIVDHAEQRERALAMYRAALPARA
jgi:deoxyribodipyrimidine photo-lyase